jgi:hypothetical protein
MRTPHVRSVLTALASAVLVTGLVTATSTPASADEPGTISGTVRDESGVPIAGANVYVNTFNDPLHPGFPYSQGAGMTTDVDGTYELPAPVGDNVLTVHADGYASSYNGGSDLFAAPRIPTVSGQRITRDVVLMRSQLVIDPSHGAVHPFVIRAARMSLNQTLSITAGDWSADYRLVPPSELTVTYQWYRGSSIRDRGTPIAGATGSTYVTSTADLKRYVSVTVTASHPLMRSGSATTTSPDPIRRHARIKVRSATSPKKRTVRLKIAVSVEGRPYASGPVNVVCATKKGRPGGASDGKLKKGKATLTVKTGKLPRRDKNVYCRFGFESPESSDTSRAFLPLNLRSRGIPVKVRTK